MPLKTILNRVEKMRSFVYGRAEFRETGRGPALEIEIRARANGRMRCSGCGRPGPGYDTLPARRFARTWADDLPPNVGTSKAERLVS